MPSAFQLSKWDLRFLELAKLVASWSKDPSTQVGCILVRDTNLIISQGFNGPPKGIKDLPERLENRFIKYNLILHAEENAILFANESLIGATAYIYPGPPCPLCAARLIQKGISRIVYYTSNLPTVNRNKDAYDLSFDILQEAQIQVDQFTQDEPK